MLVIGKQLFRWRWVDRAGGAYTHSTLPADTLPDHTNVLHLDLFRPKLEARGFATDSVKYACPLFSFRESTHRTKGRQYNYVQGILADFDVLPEGYGSFADLRSALKARFPDAVVFPSPTGKAKVCWFVTAYRQAISDITAVSFLQERIPDLFHAVDTSSSALSVAFLDAQAIRAFHEFNALWEGDTSYLQVLPGGTGTQASVDFSSLTPSTHVYKAVTLDKLSPYLQELRAFATMSMTSKQADGFAKLLCILSACPAMLTEEGMGLSSHVLGRQLDIAQSTVSRWLKQLCDLGLLKWTGNKAVAGVKAKCYVAKHSALIDSIERNKRQQPMHNNTTARGLVDVLQSQVQTHGEGNDFRVKAAFHAANAGYTVEELLEAVQAIIPDYFSTAEATTKRVKGVNKRRQEITAAYKSAYKKRAV